MFVIIPMEEKNQDGVLEPVTRFCSYLANENMILNVAENINNKYSSEVGYDVESFLLVNVETYVIKKFKLVLKKTEMVFME